MNCLHMRSEPHLLRSLFLTIISHQCRGQSPAPVVLTFHSFLLQFLSADPLLHPGEEATHRAEFTEPPIAHSSWTLPPKSESPAPECPTVTSNSLDLCSKPGLGLHNLTSHSCQLAFVKDTGHAMAKLPFCHRRPGDVKVLSCQVGGCSASSEVTFPQQGSHVLTD